jgi:hypothetical protein
LLRLPHRRGLSIRALRAHTPADPYGEEQCRSVTTDDVPGYRAGELRGAALAIPVCGREFVFYDPVFVWRRGVER